MTWQPGNWLDEPGDLKVATAMRQKLRGYLYSLMGNYDFAAGCYLKMARNLTAAEAHYRAVDMFRPRRKRSL